MKGSITLKPNPSRQERTKKIIEISFINTDGECKGLLMSLRFYDNKPVINLYRIDDGITINVSDDRE